MNVQALSQEVEQLNPDGLFTVHEGLVAQGFVDGEAETMKGLRSIITLSMQCLEIMLRHGQIQGTFDRDNLIQDNDPYLEGLLNMIRKVETVKG
jgi:hypothetical protein